MQAIYFDNVREFLSNGYSDFCENFSVKVKTKETEAPWQIMRIPNHDNTMRIRQTNKRKTIITTFKEFLGTCI